MSKVCVRYLSGDERHFTTDEGSNLLEIKVAVANELGRFAPEVSFFCPTSGKVLPSEGNESTEIPHLVTAVIQPRTMEEHRDREFWKRAFVFHGRGNDKGGVLRALEAINEPTLTPTIAPFSTSTSTSLSSDDDENDTPTRTPLRGIQCLTEAFLEQLTESARAPRRLLVPATDSHRSSSAQNDTLNDALVESMDWKRRHQCIDVFLAIGTDVHQEDGRGKTSLMLATEISRHVDVDVTLTAAASELQGAPSSRTMVQKKVRVPLGLHVVNQLLKARAEVNNAAPDLEGWAPLHYAVNNGASICIVKLLLQARARVNQGDNNGRSALILASGRDISSPESQAEEVEKVPIDDREHHSSQLIKLLLDAAANPNHAARDGWTSLLEASTHKRANIVDHLLRARARVNHADEIHGWTALMRASMAGSLEILDRLLQYEEPKMVVTEVNREDNYGLTCLIRASRRGFTHVVDRLLTVRAEVDCLDRDGWTSLMWASRIGRSDTVARLLQAGAQVDHENNAGWTCYRWASILSHHSVVSILKKALKLKLKQSSPTLNKKEPKKRKGPMEAEQMTDKKEGTEGTEGRRRRKTI